jgi:hypothetical protein
MVFVNLRGTSTRVGAFGLPTRPISKETLDQALKKAKTLSLRDNVERATRSLTHTLFLDVIFSQRLTKVRLEPNKDFPNSKVPRYRHEVTPVWKTAPTTAWKRAARLSYLLRIVARFGSDANILHELERLSIFCWSMTNKNFYGLCRKIEARCTRIANLVGMTKLPETALLGKLSANPELASEKTPSQWGMRVTALLKYGVKHRPNTLGLMASLLNSKMRLRTCVR